MEDKKIKNMHEGAKKEVEGHEHDKVKKGAAHEGHKHDLERETGEEGKKTKTADCGCKYF